MIDDLENNLNVVIVGHVDHGKSTLIGRLFYDTNSIPESKMRELKNASERLGRDLEFSFLLDHLDEERDQGITIDTARAYFKSPKRQYVIIDAPGHVEFTKNMITGASHAEAAILLVDAKEGIREQTKRHAYILGMLAIKQVVVAINKIDVINYDETAFNKLKKDILEVCSSLSITPSYIVPISAKEGDNIVSHSKNTSWYNGPHIIEVLDSFTPSPFKNSSAPLRFPVQDVYKIEDKRILVGRIESGEIKTGDEVLFLPSGKQSVVKTIEKFEETPQSAVAGESIGITLTDPLFIERGEIICKAAGKPESLHTFEANIFLLSKKPYEKGSPMAIRCATQEVPCRIEKIITRVNSSTMETIEEDASTLFTNEVGKVLIKADKPVVLDDFSKLASEIGRFVLVVNNDVAAGGIVKLT